jgi:hypothetical protein
MVLSLAEEVAEAGPTIVLFRTSTLELAEEEPVAAGLRDTLDVASVLPAVLFWNGALEAIEEEPVAAVFREAIKKVFTEPVAAVFKGTLDEATPAVLFWNGAPEVSGIGTTLPEGRELIFPFDEESTWKAEHMLAVLSPETNSPVSLLR